MLKNRGLLVTGVTIFAAAFLAVAAPAAELNIDIQFVTPVFSGSPGGMQQALIKFDIPEELDSARIDLAELTVEVSYTSTATGLVGLMCCPASQDWSVSPGGLFATDIAHNDTVCTLLFLEGEIGQQLDLDITEFLQNWIDGETPNQGLILMLVGAENATMSFSVPSSLPAGAMARAKVFYTAKEKE